jgi:heme a synthase
MENKKFRQHVARWLIAGVVLVFFQVVIGGVTRLTDSGLSITEWNVILGVLPPLNETAWTEAFEQYKTQAKTQFEQIHANMTLVEFKSIFFWEWFHRLWARMMSLIFLIGFTYFVWRKMLPKWLLLRLGAVIGIAALAAVFGWIMVKSGLNTPDLAWVNAYALTVHLGIATLLIGYLWWTYLLYIRKEEIYSFSNLLKKLTTVFLVLLVLQILMGGIVAGTKSAMAYPHFPAMTSEGHFIPPALSDFSQWNVDNLLKYNKNAFAPAFIQFMHRSLAYLLIIIGLWLFYYWNKEAQNVKIKKSGQLLITLLIVQITLGAMTVLGSQFKIPVHLGVAHQAVGLTLLLNILYMKFQQQKF